MHPTVRSVHIDRGGVTRYAPEVEHEYKTAIDDLLADNYFRLHGKGLRASGPYALNLSVAENRLVIEISQLSPAGENGGGESKSELERVVVPITPFRGLIRDYFHICENYYHAVRNLTTSHIETVDMAKRSLHNDGASLLQDILKPDVDVDFPTARRLFTLICVLHVR